MLILVGNTAGTVFFPLFSSYFSKNQLEQVKQKIFQFENFIFNFLLPFVITLSIFASPIIITLLGKRYESSAPIFSLLVISSFFIIWGMPYGNVLSGLGLFWLSTILYIMQFIIFIITLFISIHPHLLNMGSMALAITQVTINFFLFFGFYYIAWFKIKVQFIKRQLRYISLAIFIYFITYFGILVHLKVVSVYVQSFLIVPIFLLIYYSLEYFLGLLKKSDLIILLQLMNPNSSLKYVKKEFKNNSYNEPSSGL